jgi:uncharacterized protein YqjF (DUF2071 family)
MSDVERADEPTERAPVPAYGPVCPDPVDRAVMVHWWDQLTFLHWRYEVDEVQRLLPDGLTVEPFDGTAWVGLVPFYLRVGLPGVPSVPWFSRFCETNVRTYVRDAQGRTGVWFFSLDAARLGAVVVARASYQLPYFWADMSLRRGRGADGADELVYSCRIGEAYAPDELGPLDHYLTARWALFSAPFWGLRHAKAWHEPWPLYRAEALDLDDGLVAASGLSQPEGAPLVHWSPSVEVRIGWPTPIR